MVSLPPSRRRVRCDTALLGFESPWVRGDSKHLRAGRTSQVGWANLARLSLPKLKSLASSSRDLDKQGFDQKLMPMRAKSPAGKRF